MRRHLSTLTLAIALCSLAANSARAAVIEFSGVKFTSETQVTSYEEDGYVVSDLSGFNTVSLRNPADPYIGNNGQIYALRRVDGLAFNLTSLDAAAFIDVFSTLSITAGTLVQTFPLSVGFQTILPSGFVGVSEVRFTGRVALDNLVVDVVPIPAALPLLATAIGGIALAGRWRVSRSPR